MKTTWATVEIGGETHRVPITSFDRRRSELLLPEWLAKHGRSDLRGQDMGVVYRSCPEVSATFWAHSAMRRAGLYTDSFDQFYDAALVEIEQDAAEDGGEDPTAATTSAG